MRDDAKSVVVNANATNNATVRRRCRLLRPRHRHRLRLRLLLWYLLSTARLNPLIRLNRCAPQPAMMRKSICFLIRFSLSLALPPFARFSLKLNPLLNRALVSSDIFHVIDLYVSPRQMELNVIMTIERVYSGSCSRVRSVTRDCVYIECDIVFSFKTVIEVHYFRVRIARKAIVYCAIQTAILN